MRMLELRRELNLTFEPFDTHPGRHLGWQHLDDHGALEPHLLSEEDAAHPATAELALDGVGTAKMGL